jgi:hypothetical protein
MADPFKFNQDFPAVDSDAVAKFQRSFAHTDWVDGENIVQAQDTLAEEGFNARFHKIEKDLDALGDDAKQAFSEINQMRSNIFALLNEIQAEFNRLREVTAEPPNIEAVRIMLSKKKDLISSGFIATGVSTAPGGPANTTRKVAACFRDLELYLNIILESLKTEKISFIDTQILQVKETALTLGFSISWIVNFYQHIKANHGLTGNAATVANTYLDRAISDLS